MKGMSLLIVFGIPITEIARPRRTAASAMLPAPRSDPSPPMTKSMEMSCATSCRPSRRCPAHPRRTQDRPAPGRTSWYRIGRQLDDSPWRRGRTRGSRQDPKLAATPAIDELDDQATHHVVQPRAQAAARDDGGADAGRLEEQPRPRAGRLERRQRLHRDVPAAGHRQRVVEQHPVVLVHPMHGRTSGPDHRRHRRGDRRLTEHRHAQIARRQVEQVRREHGTIVRASYFTDVTRTSTS